MGTTSGDRDVAHTGGGAKVAAPPQMSNNPPVPPAGPVPAPYVTTAGSDGAQETSSATKVGGNPVLVEGSHMPTDTPGNQPSTPTGGDIVSHGMAGSAGHMVVTGGSGKTTSDGKGLVRTGESVAVNQAASVAGTTQVPGKLLDAADADAALSQAEADADKMRKDATALAPQPGKANDPAEPSTCKGTDPVAAATGFVVDDFVDLATPGVIPVQWKRHYSSGRSKERGGLGRGGWSISLEQWIEPGEAIWRLRAEDGRWIWFEKVGPGQETFHRRERLTLRCEGRGRWIEVESARTRQVRRFAAAVPGGRLWLRSIRDASGNHVDLRYDGDRLTEVTDTAGRALRLLWNAASPKTTGTGAETIARAEVWSAGERPELLQWVDYGYHGSGELARVTNALGGTQTFEYDGLHRLVRRTLETGLGFRYGYDDSGRCARTAGDGGIYDTSIAYDLTARTTMTSGHEEARRYTWTADGFITREETLDKQWARALEYDADRYVVAERNAAGETLARRYDARGNLVEVIDPAGNATRWRFDGDRPISRRDADGNQTTYQHDARGLLAGVTRPTGETFSLAYDAHGRLDAVFADGAQLYAFAYDAQHNLVREVDARGAVTEYTYDGLGRPVARRDALGRETRVAYDALGRAVSRQLPDGSTTRVAYDPRGRVTEVVDALGHVTRMQYGGLFALERLIDAHGQAWSFQYDDLERLRRIVNPLEERYEYEYDPAGRIIGERAFHGRLQKYRYDLSGNLTRIDLPESLFRTLQYDPLGNVVVDGSAHGTLRFQRDKLGRLQRAVVDEATGKVVTDFERDRFGRVVVESQDGAVIRYAHDRRGRVVERVLPSGATTRYHFDAGDALVGLEQDGKKILIQRDVLGREVRKHVYQSGVDVLSAYDALDRLIDQRTTAPAPDGQAAAAVLSARRWHYDALGRPTAIEDARWGTTTYEHDALGQLVLAARGPHREVFEYDPTGSLVNILGDLGDRGRTTPWRTETGNLLTRTRDAVYENDVHGRRVRKTPLDGRGQPIESESVRYDWDLRDRLREVAFASGKRVLFAYDAFGRRVKKTVIPTERADTAAMVALALEKGKEALPALQVSRYVWDGDAHAADVAPDGFTRVFVMEPGTVVPLLQVEQGEVFLVVNDHLGMPKELVGEDGRVAWAASHSAWGTELGEWHGAEVNSPERMRAIDTIDGSRKHDVDRPEEGSPFRLRGQYYDPDVNLACSRFRWFDPDTGRWITPDPIGRAGGLNLLSFTGAPDRDTDSLGLCVDPATQARNWQGSEDYPGVDNWRNVILPAGTRIIAGEPGLSGYFTTIEALEQAGGSAAAMQQLLQVKPHEKYAPRSTFGVYEFKVDTPAAVAITERNPQNGVGGATQFYVPTWKTNTVRVGERKLR
ncbi:MAG: DUF6531 domain-containing protein [Polyangiaceae bacterium]